ncbi:MAG: cell surface protein SprA [Dysgonomonas sp.]
MSRKVIKYLFFLTLLAGGLSLFSVNSGRSNFYAPSNSQAEQLPQDTSTRYPVKKTQITTFDDLEESRPIDLRDPSNVKTQIEYDIKSNTYLFKTKIGDDEWITPFSMTAKEYSDYSLKQSMNSYFRQKNIETFERGDKKEDFDLKDIKINIGPAERIFGPGGVKIRPQGYVEFSMGLKRTTTENPTISEQYRSKTILDVDEKIQLNVAATVGDKVNFDLNYDTEATFDFDSKKMKLAYEGKEDEIIRYLEAGNVSLNTTNSLISGATSLFGIRADLQFGKLRVNTVISQQESESQTVGSKNGVQAMPFEFKADAYDENRHFFLGHYFRDNYDTAASQLPFIRSGITINKIEVWVTNKRGNFDQARNIIGFTDLAEGDTAHISNNRWKTGALNKLPNNNSNLLYQGIKSLDSGVRNISSTTPILEGSGLVVGQDFEKIESARLLSPNEYTINNKLGYISLNITLQSDEVLAVAYDYTLRDSTYQVGEFSSNITDKYLGDGKSGALFLKLLKPVSLTPNRYIWNLMMKNIYYLGASNIQSDRFRLNISYQSDTTGTYINYLPEGAIKNELLIKVMNLDRLNNQQKVVPGGKGDGIFDFVEGYTIRASNGRLIFPVVEPFGEHLRKKFKNDSIIANKYVFQDLYDSTLTVAQQNAERNKFKISGSYKATNNNEIDLGTMNVVRGSVKVTAGGTTLAEGTDYTVDYTSGKVYITNQSIIDAGTPVSASLESQTFFNMQRKTMLGLNLSYDFSKNFNMGATFLHMYEKPLTSKTGIGSESVKNTLVGFNLSYRTESQWLTNLIDKLPFVNATAPSQIAFDGEFAKMFPGHYKNDYAGGYSYLDDFESSRSKISLRDPYGWVLASTPSSPDHLKDDRISSDTLQYGYNRALLAWYTIDNLFTRRNSNLTPQHIKNDKDQLSNHFVREINVSELYPNRDAAYNDASTLPVLNLSYYPEQRGPYNLDVDGMSTDGKLLNPDKRWGGVIRKMDNKDFEANNVEYIEFWMMDPFVYNGTGVMPDNNGGKLYFNLGEISEDILKDGRKFYENGIPVSGDPTLTDLTAWGKVPNRQSTVYAFDKEQGDKARVIQDVGFNGLSTAEELEYRTYKNYTDRLKAKLTDDAKNRFDSDPFSPLRDPAGDNYHYYRGTDYDNNNVSILDRYKYYNNTEGNSTNNPDESYSTAAKTTPDVEDIDQDNTLNETESYYEYVVDLDPTKMNVGQSNITDKRTVKVNLANGTSSDITWYQFKIPIREPDKRIGNIRGYKSIRYMRMFLTGFEQETHLRFGTLELVRGDWRVYTRDLNDLTGNKNLITVSSVNIEENGDKQPVNYVLPPGESRILDPSQPQLRQENEQALAFQVEDLEPGVSRAIYKNTFYDLRRYKRLQMFTHVEASPDPAKGELKKGNLAIFLRLGSDYKNNYYEYEIPLTVTPHGKYNSNNPTDRLTVWPQENMFDFQLELLKNVKLNRNKKKRQAGSDVSYTKPYPEYDPTKPNNKITVMGNPSLSEINVIMVGVRNLSDADKSGEIWINELRVTDFDEEGGWAAQGNLNIALSDIGTINVSGRKETVGFGSIDQSLMERRQDDYYTYSIAANVDVGRFLPEKIKAVIPLYYAYSNETVTPKYDPLDQDVTLKESMSTVNSKAEKDSIKSLAQDKVTTKSFSLSGVKLNIRSKTPMPYDPANFTFGYAHSVNEVKNPTTVYDKTLDTKASLSYAYTPIMKTWKPFENSKSKAPMSRFLKNWGFNYLPNNISFNSNLNLHYLETEIRDLESYVLGGNNDNKTFLSFSQNYFWDRDFSLSWDFTKNLKFSIQTGTKAEIEDPFLQVNKELNPDAYDEWKKVVNKSIRKFGDPLSYRQTASLTYNAPFSEIPFLDWLTATGNYTSNYNWDKGASLEDNTNIGNSLANNVTYTINGRVNMLTLYNKWEFLKKNKSKICSNKSEGQYGNQTEGTTSYREKKPENSNRKLR